MTLFSFKKLLILPSIDSILEKERYRLSNGEQKLLIQLSLYLKSGKLEKNVCEIPVAELSYILGFEEGSKSLPQLDDFLKTFFQKKVTIPSNTVIEGIPFGGIVHWISGYLPKLNSEGMPCIEFGFSPQVKSYLMGIQDKIHKREMVEATNLKSRFSIHIYQCCKEFLEKEGDGLNQFRIGLIQLKRDLEIEEKYPDFRNFRRKVLEVAKKEINGNTHLSIDFEFSKAGKHITAIDIKIHPKNYKNESNEYEPGLISLPLKATSVNPPDILSEKYTESVVKGIGMLTDYGFNNDFIVQGVLKEIKGSESIGYEDFYIQAMLQFFESKTNAKTEMGKLKAFQSWVLNRRFSTPYMIAILTEQVVRRKKQISETERTWREEAKLMSAKQFRKKIADGKPKRQLALTFTRLPELRSNHQKKAEIASLESKPLKRPTFDFETFKQENSKIYKQIREERGQAFEHLKDQTNYEILLENSIRAYCEAWHKKNE